MDQIFKNRFTKHQQKLETQYYKVYPKNKTNKVFFQQLQNILSQAYINLSELLKKQDNMNPRKRGRH